MKAKGMPGRFWGEAVTTAVFLLNRSLDAVRSMARRTPSRSLPAHIRMHRVREEHPVSPQEA